MSISNKFRNLTGASVLSLAAAFGTGCASNINSIYNEDPNLGPSRTPITNANLKCDTQYNSRARGVGNKQIGETEWETSTTCYNNDRSRNRPSAFEREIDNTKRGITRDIGNEVRGVIRDAIRGLDL